MVPIVLSLPAIFAPAGVNFRLATIADLRPLYQTCYAAQPFEPFQQHFERVMQGQASGRSCCLIAETPDLVGSGQLLIYGKSAEIANLFVLPAWRNWGIGTAMIEGLTAVARQQNTPYLEISVHETNLKALTLYQRLGFTENRRLQRPEQAIILRKTLLVGGDWRLEIRDEPFSNLPT